MALNGTCHFHGRPSHGYREARDRSVFGARDAVPPASLAVTHGLTRRSRFSRAAYVLSRQFVRSRLRAFPGSRRRSWSGQTAGDRRPVPWDRAWRAGRGPRPAVHSGLPGHRGSGRRESRCGTCRTLIRVLGSSRSRRRWSGRGHRWTRVPAPGASLAVRVRVSCRIELFLDQDDGAPRRCCPPHTHRASGPGRSIPSDAAGRIGANYLTPSTRQGASAGAIELSRLESYSW